MIRNERRAKIWRGLKVKLDRRANAHEPVQI